MSGVNKVILIGRLGQDPEVRHMPDGGAVANLSLATSEQWKDKNTGEKREKTEWHRVVFFKRLAEIVGEYCNKGSQIFVEGQLQTRKWQDKDGNDRYTTEIIGRSVQLLDSKGSSGNAGSGNQANNSQASAPAVDPDFDDDIPF